MVFLITEKKRPKNDEMKFTSTLLSMPREYRKFLLAVIVFGCADFAPTLMILRASTSLSPKFGLLDAARYAALLYLLRNIVYSFSSYPIGAISSRFSRTRYLAAGYFVAVLCFVGFAIAIPSIWWFIGCFILSGIFIAWEDTMEGVAVRDYVDESISGTAYGMLGVANGIGDFASSLIVGALWSGISPFWGFIYAIIVGTAGTVMMASLKSNNKTIS
jgi:MFS family permease